MSVSSAALIFGIPITQAEFAHSLARDREGTLTAQLRWRYPKLTADGLWEQYEPYAALACSVAADVSRAGVHVVHAATAADATRTIQQVRVATLVTHWRSALFLPSDIADASAIFAALGDPTSPLTQALADLAVDRDALTSAARGAASPDRRSFRGELAAAFNDAIQRAAESRLPRADDALAEGRRLTEQQGEYRRWRDLVVHALPDAFTGSDGIEFGGAFCDSEAFVNLLSPAYAGLLDLTICHSILLGEDTKRRCPGSTCLLNAAVTPLDVRLAIYRQIVRRMARSPDDYLAASAYVRRRLR